MLATKKLIAVLMPVAFISAVAMAAISLAPAPALAYEYSHVYCDQYLAVNGTCPPNGSSEWAHLELNLANAGGQSHETCLDDWYNEEKRFTEAHCMYYASEESAVQISFGQYGYPRAWNGGKIEHFVYAEEYGYHTALASITASPIAPAGARDLSSVLAGSLVAIPGGLESSATEVVSARYPVVVVPGETGICLLNGPVGVSPAAAAMSGRLGGVCGAKSSADEHGFAETTESASGAPVVIGLAPRGNTSVRVTYASGAIEKVPVVNNIYEITGTPSTVTLKEASGKETTRRLPALARPPATAPPAS